MTTLDRHVLRRFASASALLVALLAVTFVTFHYSERVDDFLDRGASNALVFGHFYPRYLAWIVQQVSPLAVFLAALYVTARMAQSMELTAVHMAGVSTWRFMRPMVLAAGLFTLGMVAFNGWVVPRANVAVHAFENEYYRDAPEGGGGSEVVRQAAPGTVVAARFFDREAGQAFGVTLVTFADSGRSVARRLDAAQMTWVDSLGLWRATDVAARSFVGGRERYAFTAEVDTALAVRPRDLAQSERDVERLTLPEAAAYVAALERAGVTERGRPLVAFHAKLAYPVANLVLVLIAVPLAARRRRGGQAGAFAFGLGVAVLYLAAQKTVEPLGYVQTVPPAVAAWAPHVVFGAIAVAAVFYSDR